MKVALVVALLLGANPGGKSVLDELTLSQTMRLSTMAPARLTEARCAGLARWQVEQEPSDALPAEKVEALTAAVTAAVSNDAGITQAQARAFVGVYVDELDGQKAERTPADWDSWRQAYENECAPFQSAARQGKVVLHPLANAAVIDPALVSCYGQYRAAAARASGAEAAALSRDAERAAGMALKGKEGKARVAAHAALATEAKAALKAPKSAEEATMMRLIVCQPVLHGISMQEQDK